MARRRATEPGPPAALRPRLTTGVVGLVATLTSAVASWHVSLWSDEGATISAATRSLSDLWRLLGNIDAVHGTYYLLMHGWVAVLGTSPASLRLPSALAVGVAAAGVHVLGLRLADARTALLAAVVFTLVPRVSWAGIEARPFALAVAVAVWLTVTLHIAITRRSTGLWVLYGALLALGTAVNLYLVLVAAAHALTLLARPGTRRALVPMVIAGAGGVLLASPVVLTALGQGGQLGVRPLGPVALVRNLGVDQWFLGETPTPTTDSGADLAAGELWKVAAVLLAAVCWLLVARAVLTARADVAVPAQTAGRGAAPAGRELLTWALPWLLLPTALVVAVSLVSPALYNARYFGFSAPALALLVAAGLRALPGRWELTALLLVVGLAAPVYLSQRTVSAKSGADWVLAAAHLEGRSAPGDAVYFGPRDDPKDGRVLRSLRTLSIAYPDPFLGTTDVTLVSSPAEGATLFGTSMPLADALDRLEDAETLWVVRRQDRVVEAAADDATLAALGFTVVGVWDGGQTQVVELTLD